MTDFQNIQVFVRCRPLKENERQSTIQVLPELNEVRVAPLAREFCFDQVFSADTPQEIVYNSVVKPLINQVLGGFNCTVFAYGQTGTGKTYTMEGDKSTHRVSWDGTGIIPRAVNQIFNVLKTQGKEFAIKVSFLELYSEDAYDLLSPPEDTNKLRIFDDVQRKGSVKIEGLEEILVENEAEIFGILSRGSTKRQTAATQLNACSSRSHSIFTITVLIKDGTLEDQEIIKMGKLNLVDLAGSENIARSGAQNKTAREAGNINQSLLTLTRVISALVEKRPHIPYRESKLTRILQDSLGGATRTSMIATISPAEDDLNNTVGTLDYASRARSIINKPESNRQLTQKKTSDELNREIQALKEKHSVEMCELEFKIRNEVALEFRREMEKIKESMKEQHSDQIKALESRLSASVDQQEGLATDYDELKEKYDQLLEDLQEKEKEMDAKDQRVKEMADANNQLTKDLKIANQLSEYRAELVKQIENDYKQSLLLKQALEEELQTLKDKYGRSDIHDNHHNNNAAERHSSNEKRSSNESNHSNEMNDDEIENQNERTATRKVSRIRKRAPSQEDLNDYANLTFDNGDDEIIQLSVKKPRRKLVAAGKKKDLYNPITLSGKKKKLCSIEDDVEVSPVSPPVRVTRSRATRRRLNY